MPNDNHLRQVQSIVRKHKLKEQEMVRVMDTDQIPQVILDHYEKIGLRIHAAKNPVKSTITVRTTTSIKHTWKSVGSTWELQ